MPARLADLLSAIKGEQDPAVRGRAAVLLLRDLDAAALLARDALDRAVRELNDRGLSHTRIAALLDLPGQAQDPV